jgi:hypothetical protein
MSRTFSRIAGAESRRLLRQLARTTTPPSAYRAAMLGLGRLLGDQLHKDLGREKRVALVCGVEDADFLALGALDSLETAGRSVRLVCFWNANLSLKGGDRVTPIVRRYAELADNERPGAIVVIKSIISTACVVRTNLMDLLDRVRPRRILVAAPVMFKNARRSLEQEFPPVVAAKFEYRYFAIDSRRTASGIVVPGIGGLVYNRLGIGSDATKNRYRPNLVRDRRGEGMGLR